MVKETKDDRADAIAKAKAMVEEEKKKEELVAAATTQDDLVGPVDQKEKFVENGTANPLTETQQDTTQAVSKKRERENDEADEERKIKKQNTENVSIAGEVGK